MEQKWWKHALFRGQVYVLSFISYSSLCQTVQDNLGLLCEVLCLFHSDFDVISYGNQIGARAALYTRSMFS